MRVDVMAVEKMEEDNGKQGYKKRTLVHHFTA
jgi:hypothetical protein